MPKGKIKSEEELTKDLEAVIRKLYRQLQGTDEEKKAIITKKANDFIDNVDEIDKQKQKRQRTNKKAEREQQTAVSEEKFKQRAAQIPDDIKKLESEFGISTSNAYRKLQEYGIYNRTQIVAAIRKQKADAKIPEKEANEQISKEGNISITTVARIRQEELEKEIKRANEARQKKKERRNRKKLERKQQKAEAEEKFMARAAQIPDDIETLSSEFGNKDVSKVYEKLREYGIYNRRQIVAAIRQKADAKIPEKEANEQIAREGNIEVAAVARIRQEELEREIQRANKAKKKAIQTKRTSKKVERRQQKAESEERFKQRAAQIPDDVEKLASEFGIKKANNVYKKLHEYGIYNRTQIVAAIRQKAAAGIPEEEANKQIAKEGNIEVATVARIRQEELEKEKQRANIAKQKARERRNSERGKIKKTEDSKSKTKKEFNSSSGKPEDGQIEQPKVEQKSLDIQKSNKDIKPVSTVAPKTPETVKTNKPTIVMTERRATIKPNIQYRVNQRKKEYVASNEVENLLTMAKTYRYSVDEMQSKTSIPKYEMLLELKRRGITTRDDIERLIESNPNLSDTDIANRVSADVETISKIRADISEREKLIASIPEKTRLSITSSLSRNSYSLSNFALTYKCSKEQLKALETKIKRDKDYNIPQKQRDIDFKIKLNSLRLKVKQYRGSKFEKISINSIIAEFLVDYEDKLSRQDYAFFAYSYVKIGEYLQAIDLGEETLDLQDSTIDGIKEKISEVLEETKQSETTKVTSAKPEHEEIVIGD